MSSSVSVSGSMTPVSSILAGALPVCLHPGLSNIPGTATQSRAGPQGTSGEVRKQCSKLQAFGLGHDSQTVAHSARWQTDDLQLAGPVREAAGSNTYVGERRSWTLHKRETRRSGRGPPTGARPTRHGTAGNHDGSQAGEKDAYPRQARFPGALPHSLPSPWESGIRRDFFTTRRSRASLGPGVLDGGAVDIQRARQNQSWTDTCCVPRQEGGIQLHEENAISAS